MMGAKRFVPRAAFLVGICALLTLPKVILIDFMNRALWGGFSLTVDRTRVYFSGDSAYSPLFAAVRHRIGPIDLALLPIGAYEPRWFMKAVHMNPAGAVQAHLDLGAPESIGMHFGTFQLTTEGIDEPLRALDEARAARDVPPSRFR